MEKERRAGKGHLRDLLRERFGARTFEGIQRKLLAETRRRASADRAAVREEQECEEKEKRRARKRIAD